MLRWSAEDARQWAIFSGDENPIHFDNDAAITTGANGITVHGMRSMWHLKQALAEMSPLSSEEEGVHCAIRLRSPILIERDYCLKMKSGADCARGEIIDANSSAVCFSGKLSKSPRPVFDEAGLAPRLILGRLQKSSYPLPGYDWCFLDALLFRMIVDAPESMEVVHRVLPELPAKTLGDVFVQLPIVQTHHDVWLPEYLLRQTWGEQDIEGAILPSLVMGDRQSGFILQMSAACLQQQKLIMSTTVTLKIWPLVNRNG
ncbi:hypothetical protein FHD02_12435 [Citrobacter sp. EC_71]|uniref:MaoC/PaaZ C-terminal domain-containing protein n=1 Tax=unclassified Citrobacter TaxID=2644389 RepID=UPI0010C944A8|nr:MULTISPECIES: MaoC/PaaZ C-terminal domain-containing protein [unclassified Citrobacter]MBW9352398.1 hypothetical protein [Citrobacter sp. EC_71]TKT97956.1 hypothetical protein FDW89_18670 [Citrobacter sp. wls830]TKV10739.1 hypothetical protein FDX04_21535 [Citrobacter sp. wls615]